MRDSSPSARTRSPRRCSCCSNGRSSSSRAPVRSALAALLAGRVAAGRVGQHRRDPLRRQRRRRPAGRRRAPSRVRRGPPPGAADPDRRPARAASRGCSSASPTTGANLVDVSHVREGVDLHVRETAVELVLETRGREHADTVLATLAGRATPPTSFAERAPSSVSARWSRGGRASPRERARRHRRPRRRRRRGAARCARPRWRSLQLEVGEEVGELALDAGHRRRRPAATVGRLGEQADGSGRPRGGTRPSRRTRSRRGRGARSPRAARSVARSAASWTVPSSSVMRQSSSARDALGPERSAGRDGRVGGDEGAAGAAAQRRPGGRSRSAARAPGAGSSARSRAGRRAPARAAAALRARARRCGSRCRADRPSPRRCSGLRPARRSLTRRVT